MCGRYVSRLEAAMEREWALSRPPPPFESFNVAPTQAVPVVRERPDGRVCELLRWELIPAWARGRPVRFATINARVETLASSRIFGEPWRRGRRCILPANGFYEWQAREGHGKQPWFVHLLDQELFGLAGLWDVSVRDDGTVIESVTIITVSANEFLADLHPDRRRMPAILRRTDHDAWLTGDAAAAQACLAPYPAEAMAAHTVSRAVNSARNNDPRLILPAAPV